MEVPCIKRNAIGATHAMSASDMSMMGVKSFIPMDEVVQAMMNISAHMSETIRETALGGLAVTPTGLKIREKMGLPPIPEKYLNVKFDPRPKCGGCNGCD